LPDSGNTCSNYVNFDITNTPCVGDTVVISTSIGLTTPSYTYDINEGTIYTLFSVTFEMVPITSAC
jgi:hypothetical protein